MTATISTPSTIARRVEDAANAMSLPGDGFQRFENGTGLVMGTPAAATVVFTVLVVTSTQFTSAFIGGGADRDVSPDRMPTGETPSLEDLVRLYES